MAGNHPMRDNAALRRDGKDMAKPLKMEADHAESEGRGHSEGLKGSEGPSAKGLDRVARVYLTKG